MTTAVHILVEGSGKATEGNGAIYIEGNGQAAYPSRAGVY